MAEAVLVSRQPLQQVHRLVVSAHGSAGGDVEEDGRRGKCTGSASNSWERGLYTCSAASFVQANTYSAILNYRVGLLLVRSLNRQDFVSATSVQLEEYVLSISYM